MNQRRLCGVVFLAWSMASIASAQAPQGEIAESPSRDSSREPFVIEMVKTSFRFEADGTGSKTVQARVRVQTEGGLQKLGQIVLDYNSDSERLTFTGRVIKPDGSAIPIPESATQDMSSPVSMVAPMYSDIRQKHVIVPGLRPGYTLEYELQVDQFAPFAPNHFWMAYDFERTAIVEDEELRIDVPSATYVKVKSKPDFTPDIGEENGRRIYRWKTSHLAHDENSDRARSEGGRGDDDTDPAVQLSTFQDWNAIGQWYATLEQERRAPDAAIRDKVAEITKDAGSDLEKLQAIYDFVARNFRYVSLSFGIGRYQPHAASEIFGNQYGDCKDKHTLLAAMAQAAGLDARAALTSASRKIDDTFPSPAQFDHVISYVLVGSEGVWLDTTTELAPFRMLIPPVRGKGALVVNSGGKSELRTTPTEPAVPNSSVTRIDGNINNLGTLDADVSLTLRGDAEVLARLGVRTVPQARWKDMVQLMTAGLGTVGEVSKVEITDVTDTKRPLEYRFHLTKLNYLNRFGSDPQLALPLGESHVPDPEERAGQKVVELGTWRTEYHARLQIPKQFEARLPLPVQQKRDFGEYVSKYAIDGTTLIAERILSVTTNELPASRLNEFRAFRRTVMSDSEQEVGVKVGEGIRSEETDGAKTNELLDAALAAYDNGKFRESVDLIERVVRSEPEHKTAYNDLGRAYLGLGELERAEKALTKAVEIDPFSPYAFNNLGRVLWARRRHEEAERAFRKQIEIDPLDKWSHKNLGEMLLGQEKYAAAEPELQKAVALSPKEPDLYMWLGQAQMNLERIEEGRVSFERAIEASPSPRVWNNVAFTLAEHMTDLDRAQEYAESAVSVVSAQLRNVRLDNLKVQELRLVSFLGVCWDTLGWVHFRKGDMTSAERYLRSSWQLLQEEIVADHLGQVYERMGKKDLAIEYYTYAALDPHPHAEGRKHLAALVGEAKVESYLTGQRERPGALRTFSVPALGGEGNADFFVALAPGPVVDGVRFVSGSENLKTFADALRKVHFHQEFPDKNDTRLIRRGILACARPASKEDPKPKMDAGKEQKMQAEAGACLFVLIPPDLVSSTD